ncbi:MAG: hypothetical protein WDM79_09485 [Terricaulis sp.]
MASKTETHNIAVVFVHGQGDQQPMQDVLQLAFSTWETSPRAAGGGQLARVWSVPIADADGDGDIPELRRVITDKVEMGNGDKLRVHFYQYYWAHLMSGNRFAHLWRWFLGLMSFLPKDVPTSLRPLRNLIMMIALCLIGFAILHTIIVLCALRDFHIFSAYVITPAALFGAALTILVIGIWPSARKIGFYCALVVLIAGLFVIPILSATNVFILSNQARATLGVSDRWAAALDVGGLIPVQMRASPNETDGALFTRALEALWLIDVCLAVIIGGLFLYLSKSFLVPVMGDSARYFSRNPDNIHARSKIRNEGVKLLRRLHASAFKYKRIIVVGHSLGSVVAYGMVDQFWGETEDARVFVVGSVQHKALEGVERAALDLKRRPRSDDSFARWRDAQRAYFMTARNASADPWLISDLVTLGSPIHFGAFLLSESEEEFEAELRKHRRFGTCPPDGVPLGDRSVFSYEDDRGYLGPQHSAAFSAVQWTNLYFQTRGLVEGDLIGGPIAPKMGPACWTSSLTRARREKALRIMSIGSGRTRRKNHHGAGPTGEPTPTRQIIC